MGLLNSALQIGRNAILSYQGALQVVGGNISNAGSPDHTRLTPQLDPLQGTLVGRDLQPGAGVVLDGIRRHIDEALEGRVREAIGDSESAAVQQQSLAQLETLFDDINGTGIGTRLTAFLNGFDELQNTPESDAIRDLTTTNGVLFTEAIRALRGQLAAISEDINVQIGQAVVRADEIARRIGELNEEITRAESNGQSQATALRDQRDALLRDLSEIVDVTVREQSNGSLNVYIGSETLIQGNRVRGLVAVEEIKGEFTLMGVRFSDSGQQVDARGGRLAGLIRARDEQGIEQIAALDELAAALVFEVNRIHADGQGMVGFTSVIGSNAVDATDAALDAETAGLGFPPQSGSFFLTVADNATGTPVAYRIDVESSGVAGGTTLQSLVSDINDQTQGVTASITNDNRLSLTANDGFSFTFGYDGQEARADTSGVLAALGVNTFFTGSSARDLAVNSVIVAQPRLLAASSVFRPGDGSAAGSIAALDSTKSSLVGGRTLGEFYNTISNSVAVAAGAGKTDAEATSAVLSALSTQRESISGVNLDEEAISLLKFERAFQGASRYVSVVNDLLDELVRLVR